MRSQARNLQRRFLKWAQQPSSQINLVAMATVLCSLLSHVIFTMISMFSVLFCFPAFRHPRREAIRRALGSFPNDGKKKLMRYMNVFFSDGGPFLLFLTWITMRYQVIDTWILSACVCLDILQTSSPSHFVSAFDGGEKNTIWLTYKLPQYRLIILAEDCHEE